MYRFLLTILSMTVFSMVGMDRGGYAQVADVQTVEDRSDRLVLEVTAEWPQALGAVVDSLGASHVSAQVALVASGGLLTVSERVELPALARPNVRVLRADFDEVTLPAADGAEADVADLDQPPVDAIGLGVERKQPVVSVRARLLTYDEASGTLRRYRRMVVAVEYGTTPVSLGKTTLGAQAASTNPHLAVEQSILADGIVYKMPIQEEGVYRISRDFLDALPGLDRSPDEIDPDHLQVFGNGGKPLPALNAAPRPADLVENPVFVRGGGDGSFDEGDELIFYAAGPTGWNYVAEDDGRGGWEHYVHPFSATNYYFLKIADTSGRRIESSAFPDYPDPTEVREVMGRHFIEYDAFMWSRESGGTGHTWVSTLLQGGQARTLLDGVVMPGMAAGTVTYQARVAIRSNPSATLFFESDGVELADVRTGIVGNSPENPIARSRIVTFTSDVAASAPLNLDARLEDQAGVPQAALDWVRVFYPDGLQAQNNQLRFATPAGQQGRFEFVLRGFSSEPRVWDVTDPGTIRPLGVQAVGNTFRVQVDVADPEDPRELVAFVDEGARPLTVAEVCPDGDEAACRVPSQNLHGIQNFPDFVIVTPAVFRPFAQELADLRRQEGLKVNVVDVQQIYNEFSGGLPDMRAVRDYFKFLYDRAPDEARMPRYALLFGDGHFNFRNLGDTQELENWILPFETEETFDPIASYTSDDYFGLLDDHEGRWIYTGNTSPGPVMERVDLGIGRFTVQTEDEARTVVEKIKRYESPETYGPWRSRYLFVADDALTGRDGAQDDDDLHTRDSDVVAELVRREFPPINVRKVYGISFEREFLNEWRLPGARREVFDNIDEGILLFNYSGHGGEEGLAQESIFTKEDARALQNRDQLPIFVTATCSFGRWDLDNEQSGAEELLLNPNGGAIALMTTVRTVYTSFGDTTSLNLGLNRQLNEELFRRDDAGLPRRLGDAMRYTKNTTVGLQGNNRKFNLLGDPTMRIGLPSAEATITRVNEVALKEEGTAQLRALERVSLAGEIRSPGGTVDATFNGEVSITVFDAAREIAIQPEDWRVMPQPFYRVREDLIWRGRVNAVDGHFDAAFVVPKDISYSNKPGRISAYASSEAGQALGYTQQVVVGGTAPNPPDDSQGPDVSLFLNDTTFVSGGLTSTQPQLIVKLFDESGINTVGAGVGHEMLLVVDGDEENAVDIGDLYQSDQNSYQRGTVKYSFEEEVAPGPHTLSVKAWDVLNNSSTATVDFLASEAEGLELRNVYNYPNPTNGPTRFVFEHNQPVGTLATVRVRIYTISGRPIRTIEQEEVLGGGPVQILWEGRDDDFDQVATGVYLYKVRVEVDGDDGERHVSERIEKLAVIR